MTGQSVCLVVLLSLPLTYLAGKMVGGHGLYVTLPFVFRLDALGTAAVVTVLNVWLATQKSLRVPVRKVLL
jgi:hypothetical protein